MKLFPDLFVVQVTQPTVLTIGTFDGLHLGHQDLLHKLKLAAQKRQAQSAVIAFHPRPKAVFGSASPLQDYLTTAEERVALFEQFGIDILILIPFTVDLSQMSAYDFMEQLSARLKLVELHVGHDFALGKNREGNVDRLKELGEVFNYSLAEIDPFRLKGQVVSSTQVRAQLLAGDVRQASYLLGRYPALTGKIVRGVQRGRTIGFPTANFAAPEERLLPANGVYATFIRRQGEMHRYPSVTNIGIRPSFGGQERAVETYIFDFDEDIYEQKFLLEFVERLRSEQKFDNLDALIAQIRQDAAQARELLTAETVSIS